MGTWFSSEHGEKITENTGEVQNNITINDPVTIQNQEIIIMLFVICAIKTMEFVYFIYRMQFKCIRKRIQKPQREFKV